jgi:hypothetical protein
LHVVGVLLGVDFLQEEESQMRQTMRQGEGRKKKP